MLKKYWILFIPFLLVFILSSLSPRTAQAQSSPSTTVDERSANQALCLPDIYPQPDPNCTLAGPAQRLTDLAKLGITFPAAPLPIVHPSINLFQVPFSYARLSNDPVPVYATLADAEQNKKTGELAKSIIKYVSYTQKVATEKGSFYQIATGQWINASAATKVSIPYFQGYLIKEDLPISFGWILSETTSRTTPGYSAPLTGITHQRAELIRVYASQTIDNMEWDMIGPSEWVEHRFVSQVIPHTTPPEGVTGGRWIEVNLYEQTLMVYDNDKLIFATMISSGVDPFFTKPGLFKIYKKLVNDPMYGAFAADRSDYYYLEDVPYIMYYDQSRALHAAYWNTLFGYSRSHGCVNLSVGDAHWLYDWAQVGDPVYVWDPSGETPTDPSYYGSGGF